MYWSLPIAQILSPKIDDDDLTSAQWCQNTDTNRGNYNKHAQSYYMSVPTSCLADSLTGTVRRGSARVLPRDKLVFSQRHFESQPALKLLAARYAKVFVIASTRFDTRRTDARWSRSWYTCYRWAWTTLRYEGVEVGVEGLACDANFTSNSG